MNDDYRDDPLAGAQLDTLAVRAGIHRTAEGEHAEPIFATSSYVFASAAEAAEQAKADLKVSIARRMAAAEDQIASAEAAALKEVRDRAVSIAIGAAKDVIAKQMTADDANKLIQDFPDDGIQVLNGRYGPYITNKKKNARVPKDREPKTLTLEECQELLAAAPERGRRGKKKTTKKKAAKKKTAKKKASKKKTKKKAAKKKT